MKKIILGFLVLTSVSAFAEDLVKSLEEGQASKVYNTKGQPVIVQCTKTIGIHSAHGIGTLRLEPGSTIVITLGRDVLSFDDSTRDRIITKAGNKAIFSCL